MSTRKLGRTLSLIAFPAVVGGTIVAVIVFRHQLWEIFSSPERIQAAIAGWGVKAPIAFILIQVIQVVVFVIPGEVPQIAGGYLFGMWHGILYSTLGILAGSSFNFFLARWLGVPFVRTLFRREQVEKLERIAHSSRAQIAFFLLFVIPGIPKDVLCYVAGISPLRYLAFVGISTIGRLPGIIGSAGMGEAAAAQRWVLALAIFGGATVLFVLGLLFRDGVHRFIERFALRGRSPVADEDGETS